MLDLVKNWIVELQKDSTTFPKYYLKHVCEVQDNNIEREIAYLNKHSSLTVSKMMHLIDVDAKSEGGIND